MSKRHGITVLILGAISLWLFCWFHFGPAEGAQCIELTVPELGYLIFSGVVAGSIVPLAYRFRAPLRKLVARGGP